MRWYATAFLVLAVVGCDGTQEPVGPSGVEESLTRPTTRSVDGQNNAAEVIVTLEPRTNPGQFARATGIEPTYVYTHVMNGFAGRISDVARQGLLRDYRVVRIDVDQEVSISGGTQPGAPWGLDRIDQRSPALDGLYTYEATGAGVTAYIVDTGIRYSHSDFGGRAAFGFDAFDEGGIDCEGHGTHVAGTVGGSTYGVAKDVALVAVRVLNCGGLGRYSGVIAGLEWIVADGVRPAIVNMSLGGSASDLLDAAVQSVIDAGIPVAVAAGNRGKDACDYSPSRVPDAMTIAATDETDQRPSWSNWGNCVDWFAPGVGILSASFESDDATATKTGTSMAAPHTAGAAALYLEMHPTATPAAVAAALAAAATTGVVASSNSASSDLLYSLGDGSVGDGGNAHPVADFSFLCTDNTCDFSENATDSDGSVVSYEWDFGDGSSASAPNPTHTYGGPGTYPVSLIVRDDGGASGGTAKNVTIATWAGNQAPTAAFTATCTGLSCDFQDGSTDADGTISHWQWDFGDGNALSVQSAGGISHTFTAGGTYTVTLTVTDNSGASSTATQVQQVQEPGLVLSATGFKVKGRHAIEFQWTGAGSTDVDIYVDDVVVDTAPNSGSYTYFTANRGQQDYLVRVCESGTTTCSADLMVSF